MRAPRTPEAPLRPAPPASSATLRHPRTRGCRRSPKVLRVARSAREAPFPDALVAARIRPADTGAAETRNLVRHRVDVVDLRPEDVTPLVVLDRLQLIPVLLRP